VKYLLIALTLFYIVGISVSVSATVLVNEAMFEGAKNPSGLSWVEIYNNSDDAVALTGMSLMAGGLANWLSDILLQPHGYLVVCNKTLGSNSFESRWGDSSGVWGDRSFEQGFMLVELPIPNLRNNDSVVLSTSHGIAFSALYWSADSSTRSWERANLTNDSAVQCVFGTGGTPGEINSSLAVEHDLSIESVFVRPYWPSCEIVVTIKNVGTEASTATNLTLANRNNFDPDTIASVVIPALAPGEQNIITTNLSHNGMWLPVASLLADDQRLSNNHTAIMIVGDDYPPLFLSEIMAAPLPNGGGEWIEIRRRSDTSVNLQGWSIRDASRSALLSDTTLLLSDSIAVLIQSETEFLAAYGNLEVTLIEPVSWATLNNGGDEIRLIDPYGIVADRCIYEALAENGRTLARAVESGFTGRWLTSSDPGGTPGAPNRVISESESEPILTINPQTISPDGDGLDETAVLSVFVPSRSECTLRIFDRYGKVVHTFLSDQSLSSNEIVWDGRDMNGGRLPIGIYVALLEVSGGPSVRKALVLAR
jgi:Lamin Tail Domain/CHU_C Type IX secretion signal domain